VRVVDVGGDSGGDTGLRVSSPQPGASVITATGQIEGSAVVRLRHCLEAQVSQGRVVVVDLAGVTFLGSAGLSTLFEANERAHRRGGSVVIGCPSHAVSWALAAAGLQDHFHVATSVASVLAHPPNRRRTPRAQRGDASTSRRPTRTTPLTRNATLSSDENALL
jgi:anti-sigma B factor antagonist